MLPMSDQTDPDPLTDPAPPSDVYLLLRAHAEARWLSHEVLPVLRELEQSDPPLPAEELDATLAYLAILWIEAIQRGSETDTAYAEHKLATSGDHDLSSRARGYREAVLTLRESLGPRVSGLIAVPTDAAAPAVTAASAVAADAAAPTNTLGQHHAGS
jgi:hypothetical protein